MIVPLNSPSRPEDREALLTMIRKSGLIDEARLNNYLREKALPDNPDQALAALVDGGLITSFHARHLRMGKTRGFLLGPYRVLRPLGQGQMGLVYLAEQTSVNRCVAIKVLRTEKHKSAGARERFAREGRALAALNHPNIVRVYDVQNDGDVHYMVMQYVEGKSLSQILRESGRLPVSRAIDVIRQVALGLQHAHQAGIIHRDLDPSNILMERSGTVKILDMGLARFYEDHEDNLTERVGGALGSADFMAPEQANNQADIRTDIYSLGATFYYLLLGEPPFVAPTTAAKIIAHQTKPVVPPHVRDAAIPLEVSAVILRMLAKSPQDRYQTATEVLVALSVTDRPSPSSAELQPLEPIAPPSQISWWVVASFIILAAAIGGVLAWGVAGFVR